MRNEDHFARVMREKTEYEADGAPMVAVWETSNDEWVCDICRAREGRDQGDGWNDPKPAHPGCRCSIGLRMA